MKKLIILIILICSTTIVFSQRDVKYRTLEVRDKLIIYPGSKMGIGVKNPTKALEIIGDSDITGNLTVSGTFTPGALSVIPNSLTIQDSTTIDGDLVVTNNLHITRANSYMYMGTASGTIRFSSATGTWLNGNANWMTFAAPFFNFAPTATSNIIHKIDSTGVTLYNGTMLKADSVSDVNNNYETSMRNLINPPHAFMRFADSSVTITISSSDTFYQITNDTDSLYRILELSGGFTSDGDTLFLPVDGHYEINFAIGVECGSNNNIKVRVNSTDGVLSEMVGGTGFIGDYDAISCPAYYHEGDAGDKVWLELANTTDTDNFDIISSIVTIKWIHP